MAESFTLVEKHGIQREKIAQLLSETLFAVKFEGLRMLSSWIECFRLLSADCTL